MSQLRQAARTKAQAQPDQTAVTTTGPSTPQNLLVAALTDPRQLEQINLALPPGLSQERFNRIALTAVKSNPDLLKLGATPQGMKSVIAAIHRCAQMGLEPNSDLGHAYLLPFGNALQFIVGYKGLLAMARRSGGLKRLDVHEVYDNDEFEVSYGLNGTIVHKPLLKGDRGDVYCYYGYAEFTDGGYYYTHMTLADIDERKQRSASVKAKKKSPWDTDPVSMSKKTVVRAMAPYLPLGDEMQQALADDEKVIDGDGMRFIDIEGHDPVPAGPEQDEPEAAAIEASASTSASEPDPEPEPEPEGQGVLVPPRDGCTCGVPGDAKPSEHADDCALVE